MTKTSDAFANNPINFTAAEDIGFLNLQYVVVVIGNRSFFN